MTTFAAPAPTPIPPPLLSVQHLTKRFPVRLGAFRSGTVTAVDDVSFTTAAGETLGIVGESGCGKSTTARLVLDLIAPDSGDIVFDGTDTRALPAEGRKAFRRQAQMVFQNPHSSVNPRLSIGENIAFPLKVHGVNGRERRERVATLLEQVGLHANHASYFPHQLSGGQLQRVNIARALALGPKLVVCDEPVSALDKSIQAQVLNLLADLQEELGLTYLFISHDLNVVEYVSDRVLVMYLGQVVESCGAAELYREPLHPYTRALLAAIPDLDEAPRPTGDAARGEMPSPLNPPSGCPFRARCAHAMAICANERPVMTARGADHQVACHLYG